MASRYGMTMEMMDMMCMPMMPRARFPMVNA